MYVYIINGGLCIQNLVNVCLSLLKLTKLSIKYVMDGWLAVYHSDQLNPHYFLHRESVLVCLFALILYTLVNNFYVMSGWVCLN